MPAKESLVSSSSPSSKSHTKLHVDVKKTKDVYPLIETQRRVIRIMPKGNVGIFIGNPEKFPPTPGMLPLEQMELLSTKLPDNCTNASQAYLPYTTKTITVTGDYVYVDASYAHVKGNFCAVYGNECIVDGDDCDVYGAFCVVNGKRCRYWGKLGVINGEDSVIRGIVDVMAAKNYVLEGGSIVHVDNGVEDTWGVNADIRETLKK